MERPQGLTMIEASSDGTNYTINDSEVKNLQISVRMKVSQRVAEIRNVDLCTNLLLIETSKG
jgi:hypothetical protein